MDEIERRKKLAELRAPFSDGDISKLPKGSKSQNECPAADKVNCNVCGGWHHPKIIHLDYIGHAAITNRLLNVDPEWNWEPLSLDEHGLPMLDRDGGLWIKLTVCGVTRLGYGDAQGKTGSNAMKERIGDALRNVMMRFGGGLELWHKGELSPPTPIEDEAPLTPAEISFLMSRWIKKKELPDASLFITQEALKEIQRLRLEINQIEAATQEEKPAEEAAS